MTSLIIRALIVRMGQLRCGPNDLTGLRTNDQTGLRICKGIQRLRAMQALTLQRFRMLRTLWITLPLQIQRSRCPLYVR